MKISILKYVSCALLLFISVRTSAQVADSSFDNLSLKDLLKIKITTAGKTSQSLELASAVVTVISREQIRARGYQSLLDVLMDLDDIKVDDKMYSGMRNSLTVRGVQGSEKFIILIDGINISSPSGEAMPIMQNYPVNLAEQVEVLYGPASALYGANAVSGIINIITKRSSSKKITIDASSSGGDYGYSNTTLMLTKKIASNMSIVLSGQYYYDRNPDYSKLYKNDSLSDITAYSLGTFNTIFGSFTPKETVRPKYEAPLEAYNIYASVRMGDLSMNFFRNSFKVPTAYGNNTLNSIFNKDVFMEQSITTANVSYKRTIGKFTGSTALTSSRYNLDPASNYRNLYTSMERAYKYSNCTMIKAEQQVDYKASDKFGVTAGVGYEDYNALPQSADLAQPVDEHTFIQGSYLGTSAYYRPGGLAAPFYFIHYNNISTYLQSQYSPSKKLHFTLGARYDRNSRFGPSFNPRLGMVYQPSAKTNIKLLYGSAFRAPAPSESYTQYGAFDTPDSGRTYHAYFLHLPNPALKPIISQNLELNIQHRISNNFMVTLDAYYTYLKGLYAFADDNQSLHLYNNSFNGIPVDYVEVFINNDRQKSYGGSIQLNWKQNIRKLRINAHASLSLVNGVREDGPKERLQKSKDMQLEFISPVMAHAGIDLAAGKFSFSPRIILMGKQNISGVSDTTGQVIKRQTIAGYELLNIALRYTISKQFSVFANVSNALNEHYRNVSFNMDLNKKDTELYYGQPQDPIRVMCGFNFIFSH